MQSGVSSVEVVSLSKMLHLSLTLDVDVCTSTRFPCIYAKEAVSHKSQIAGQGGKSCETRLAFFLPFERKMLFGHTNGKKRLMLPFNKNRIFFMKSHSSAIRYTVIFPNMPSLFSPLTKYA